MSKTARGTKRNCKSCGARFYDLERDPIVCPACGVTFTFDAPPPKPAPKAKPAAPAAPEPEEPKPKPKPAKDAPEIISLDEVEAQERGDTAESEDEEAIAEIADDDTDIPDSDDEKDAFLETEDEPESDVKDIIGGPVKDEGSA